MFLFCDTYACPQIARFTILGSHYCGACLPRVIDRVFDYVNRAAA